MTSNKSHADFQKLNIYKDVDTKLHNVCLWTQDVIIKDDIKTKMPNLWKKPTANIMIAKYFN